MSAVFDASVVVKWFIADPLTAAAKIARTAHQPAVAPSMILVEVANTLRRYVVRGDITPEAARINIDLVPELIQIVDIAEMIDEAFLIACRYNHSMTDCLYAVAARRRGLPLLTADAKLARKLSGIEGFDIRLLGPEVNP